MLTKRKTMLAFFCEECSKFHSVGKEPGFKTANSVDIAKEKNKPRPRYGFAFISDKTAGELC